MSSIPVSHRGSVPALPLSSPHTVVLRLEAGTSSWLPVPSQQRACPCKQSPTCCRSPGCSRSFWSGHVFSCSGACPAVCTVGRGLLARALQTGRGSPVGRAWLERAWGFPLQVSGLLLLGLCATGAGYAARLGVGGLGASGSAPVRGAQCPSLRGSWPQPGLRTVPKAVLSWHTCGYAAAYGIGASGSWAEGP